MKPLLILVALPILIGVVSAIPFRAVTRASLAATIGAPLVVYLCVSALDPDGTWGWLAVLLVSPLVIAVALVTVQLWFGRSRIRKRRLWHDA